MKRRRWVIALFLGAVCLAVFLYQGVRYVEKEKDIEKILIRRISPLISGRFEVRDIRVGFLSAYLEGVRLTLPLQGLNLAIRDIKVGFSLRKLFRTRGDFGRSISRIILVHPRLDILIFSPRPADTQKVAFPRLSLTKDLPVDYIEIRDGDVAFAGEDRGRLVFGDGLNGKIHAGSDGVAFDMHGRMASRRRNMSFSGLLSRDDARNRLSIRLDQARISRPLQWKGIAITGGTLDGACEFFFEDTLTPSRIESRGYVSIARGECRLDSLEAPVENFHLRVNLSGTRLALDTLSWRWNEIHGEGGGAWDFASPDSGRIALRCRNITPAALLPELHPLIYEQVLGNAWIGCALTAGPSGTLRMGFSGGGLTVAGIPVTGVRGRAYLDGSTVVVDSTKLSGPGLRLGFGGRFDFTDSRPAYSVDYTVAFDSVPSLPIIRGSLQSSGSVRGTGPNPVLHARVSGSNIRIGPLNIGSTSASLSLREGRLALATDEPDRGYVSVNGRIDGLTNAKPRVECKATLQRQALRDFAAFSKHREAIVPSSVQLRIGGYLNSPVINGTATMNAGSVRGRLSFACSRPAAEQWHWEVHDDGLLVGDTAFPLSAGGSLWRDTVVIDSFHAAGALRGEGRIISSDPPRIQATLVADDLDMGAAAVWLFKRKGPLGEGLVSGSVRLWGTPDSLSSSSELHVRDCSLAGLSPLSTDAVVMTRAGDVTILPLVVRMSNRVLLTTDTLSNRGGLRASGEFSSLNLKRIAGHLEFGENLRGNISGRFRNSPSGLPINVTILSDTFGYNQWVLDSLRVTAALDSGGMTLRRLTAVDSARTRFRGSGHIPWESMAGRTSPNDTISLALSARGNLLATFGRHMDSPIGGRGNGEAHIAVRGTAEGWQFTRGSIRIPEGKLKIAYFVPDGVRDYELRGKIDDSSRVHIVMNGRIRRSPVTIYTSHDIPPGYEPIMVGPLNLGVVHVATPEDGIEIHLPGFMAVGETGEIHFGPREPMEAFALSGPADRVKITGTWTLRNLEFTFPLLNDETLPWDFDPFPYATWELDIKPGNRKVVYFWDLRGKRNKFMRFFEGTVDLTSLVQIRGRMRDETFRIEGRAEAHRGAVYFGKVFDHNVDVGVEFVPRPLPERGYDNLPIIQGSAEALSDTSRFDRIKLTLQVTDPVSGSVSEKGRVAMVPATGGRAGAGAGDSIPNFEFRLSSDFEEIPGESQRMFYRRAGLRFVTLEGAGGMVSDFGEQYLHRYFLQQFERRLAKRLGLDVITFETSIASNYFYYLYHRRFDELHARWNVLANMGITVGRYVLGDLVFFKARGELVPADTLLRPEYSLGLEFMPAQYLVMDFNAGIYQGEEALRLNPQVRMQLQLPISPLRKMLNF